MRDRSRLCLAYMQFYGKHPHGKDSAYRDNAATLVPHDTPKSSTLVIPELPKRENTMLSCFKDISNACELNVTANVLKI